MCGTNKIELSEALTAIARGDFDGNENELFNALNARVRAKRRQERAVGAAANAGVFETDDLVRVAPNSGFYKYIEDATYEYVGKVPRTRDKVFIKPTTTIVSPTGANTYSKGVAIRVPVGSLKLLTKKADRTDLDEAAA